MSRGDEILGLVVDRVIGAQGETSGTFLRAAGGHDDTRAEGFGEHDCGRANATRASMNEQSLTRLQSGALKDVQVHREEGLRNRRGLLDRDRGG